MAMSEEQWARAVDDVLEPAWAHERRRGVRRLAFSTVGRIALGLLTMWAVAFGAHLFVGENFPWVYFVVITLLGTTAAALMNMDGSAHLERD
jgi:hypothetical protein